MSVDENLPIGSLRSLNTAMEKWGPQLARIAPPGRAFDYGRFSAVVMSCASRTPKVLLCSYYSIRQAVNAAAELGLELGGVSGEAFLIPYENNKKIELPNGQSQWVKVLEATFIPGYKGFLRLAYESGLFRDVGCDVILPDDEWEAIRRGPSKLVWGHTQGEPKERPPIKIAAERWSNRTVEKYEAEIPPLRGAYAFVKLVEERSDDIVKPIWFDRLEAIRTRSKAGMNGPWITDYHEMAKKTAVRNLWKHIPKSDSMRRAEDLDQEFDMSDVTRDARTPEVITAPALAPADVAKAKTDRVAERIRARAEAATKPAAAPTPETHDDHNAPPNHDGDDAGSADDEGEDR